MSKVRGIRGAVRAKENSEEEIISSTRKLILKMIDANDIEPDDIASIFFTATSDLNAEYPAYAMRGLGYDYVPLLCSKELEVPKGMTRIIRVLMQINTEKFQENIRHQYLGETGKLRPELCGGSDDDRSDEN